MHQSRIGYLGSIFKNSFFWSLLVLILSSTLIAQTQITSGVIQGTVTDAQGAVVPGATVEANNLDTNLVKTLTTDSDGRFVFLQLPSGRYEVTVKKQGFANIKQQNLALTVGQAISLTFALKVSSTEETIVVTASPVIDTTKTESSTTLNERSVSRTPVLGRKFEDLLTLTPGVSIVQGPDGDEITFAGQRGTFNNISLNGGDNNNGFFGEQVGGQRAAVDITLDAVKEFQVVATGANAEFGRTAGGVVNVITKSGTNEVHGSLFHYQRLEALSANTSDGKPLQDFRREQFGGTVGGPIKKDKMFIFGAVEQIMERLSRENLSTQLGPTPCPVSTPTVPANEGIIVSNADCQRLALLNFFKTRFNDTEGLPVIHTVRNTAILTRYDWNVNRANQFFFSFNFDRSNNQNQTFDVPTYGNSANGTEGASKIYGYNANLFTTVSATKLNEVHFTYSRENRPRSANQSPIPADVAMGFGPTFRFGNPFFLQPGVDELFWRTQIKDNFSIISGKHTVKFGGEWIHSLNDQVFRGFFTGRYLFDSVNGFIRYASPASLGPGFGPHTQECSNGTFVDSSTGCPVGTSQVGPLLLYLQGAATSGPTTDAVGASNFTNQDYALFAQDQWKVKPNLTLNYGLRWEAQIFPDPFLDPSKTAYGVNLSNPKFPSDGTLPSPKKQFQPRVGLAWDIFSNSKSVLRGSFGIFNARQNMLTQVGSLTTNGVQQQTLAAGPGFGPTPTFPGVVTPPVLAPGTFPFQPGVTVFSKDYANPRIYSTNFTFEQQFGENWVAYTDFTWSKGVHLTRFLNPNVGPTAVIPVNGDTASYTGASPFPNLGAVTVVSSSAKSLYRGGTFGVRHRLSNHFQLDANYVLSKDMDDDSNERDPFTFRYFNLFNLGADYSLSDRDIRHKFNLSLVGDLPKGFEVSARIQARSAQPITDNPLGTGTGAPCSENNSRTRVVNGIDCGRNHLRKDNAYFSFDWRLSRPFKFGERYSLTPTLEMFNTFNNANNVNPLVTPGLFNFDGFLRQGVGDPFQVQLALRFSF